MILVTVDRALLYSAFKKPFLFINYATTSLTPAVLISCSDTHATEDCLFFNKELEDAAFLGLKFLFV